jgi:hypothetical protein
MSTSEQDESRGGTFHQHAVAQSLDTAGGRFGAAMGAPTVIGAKPSVASQYPAASSAHQVELPREEPLGFAIDQMPIEPSAEAPSVSSSVENLGPALADDAPSDHADALRAGDAGPLSSALGGGSAPAESFPAAATAKVGSSPTNQERR